MARDPRNYAAQTQLSTSASTIIAAVPDNTKAIIRTLKFNNTGSSTRTVTVYIVAASPGTAATTNEAITKAIPAGKTWNVIEAQGEILEPGMTLQAKQDAGTDVNINCSGADIT